MATATREREKDGNILALRAGAKAALHAAAVALATEKEALRETESQARSTDTLVRLRAEGELPAARARRRQREIAVAEARAALDATEAPYVADRERHHAPKLREALAAFDSALTAVQEAHERYAAAWESARADGLRPEHCGWSMLTGQRDVAEALAAWRAYVRRTGAV